MSFSKGASLWRIPAMCLAFCLVAKAQTDTSIESLLQEIDQSAAEETTTNVQQDTDVIAPSDETTETVVPAEELVPETNEPIEDVWTTEETPAAEPTLETETEQPALTEGLPGIIEGESTDASTDVSLEAPVESSDAETTEELFGEVMSGESTDETPVTEDQTTMETADDILGGMTGEQPVEEAPVTEDQTFAPTETESTDDILSGMMGEEPMSEPEIEAPAETTSEEFVAPVEEEEPVEEDRPVKSRKDKPRGERAEAKLTAQQEEVRRQALEVEGRKSYEAGIAAYERKEYAAAITKLQEGLANIPVRPANEDILRKANSVLGEAAFQQSLLIYRKDGDIQEAKRYVDLALEKNPGNQKAAELREDIDKEIQKQARLAELPTPPKKRPEYIEKTKTIDELLWEARQFYKIEDYNNAEALYVKVLLEDEYNVEAMRYLRKIDELRYAIKTKERDATSAKMMAEVRDRWNPPLSEDVELPPNVHIGKAVSTETGAQVLQSKLEKIILPSLEFRQANINDVIKVLVDESVAADPDGVGVNIILNLNIPGQAPVSARAPATSPELGTDIFGGGGLESGLGVETSPDYAASANIPTVTLNLRRISLLDAIKYITEVAALKYRIEDNVVIITPEGVVSGRVLTRLYPVQPSILDVVVTQEDTPERGGDFIEMGTSGTKMEKTDVKQFFERAGVPFPAGTSITYNQSISQLIVANTPENLEVFERILSRLNVIPNQVEIEARFVEIAQDDLEELGLQWILTDNYEFLQNKNSVAPLGGAERVQINKDTDGFTKGLRFFNFNNNSGTIDPLSTTLQGSGTTALGGIMSIASVLTNPELTVVLQALSQHGGTDLLSAPRVTSRSGVEAQIQVVTEIIYPTEFETTQPQFNDTGNVTTPPVVTPGSFETRETGVILKVTPTVGPDGYTIDLTLTPEVSELVDWIQYGSVIQLSETQSFTFNIPQPIFASRNVATSIVIWDGQTVVMGGLIREDLITVKDKIPILGDIPLLGRLFRTEGEYSKKKNLIIFVTARLVDPAGKPIHRGETLGMAEGGAADVNPTATP